MNSPAADSNQRLIEKIQASHLFQSYSRAFQTVSGLPLVLLSAHGSAEFVCQEGGPASQNEFCQLINAVQGCHECAHTHVGIMREGQDRVASAQCFAGFEETAVPVHSGGETVAYLRVGQILHERPTPGDFQSLVGVLIREGYDDAEIKDLHRAYMQTKVVSESDYQQIVTLLAIFSLQLSDLINQLLLAKNDEEPPLIMKAKQYIREHLDERMTLQDVAESVNVSSYYFCKIFKQTTRITFTEYVNRKRVEWAKKALLNPRSPITEVAFAVGYQSLSQFNRSFLKYGGESPTQYRQRMLRTARGEAELLTG